MPMITGNPYPGWRAFQEADRDRFHGRGTDTDEVVKLWAENHLTVLNGAVASGKTSLLRAGVYPAMQQGARPGVLPLGLMTGDMALPFAVHPEHNPYTYALLSSWSPNDVPARLAGLTVCDFLRQLTQRHDGILFAAIDQVEDIAIDANTRQRRAWREQFLTDLAQACKATPQLHLLLAARSEAVAMISASVGTGAQYDLKPLSGVAALEAVTAPAASAGRSFALGTARQLIDQLLTSRICTPSGEFTIKADRVEPALLQAACHHLWLNLPDDSSQITDWELREYSDVDSVLAHHCAELISKVAAENDIQAQRLHAWLLSAFITDAGTRGVVYEGHAATAGMPNAIAHSLGDRQLLSCERRSATRWYQLLSDRLIEPLRHARFGRAVQPTADRYLRAARRELSLGDVDAARRYATNAQDTRPGLRTRADAECLLGDVAYEEGDHAEALSHYREAADLLQAAGDAGAAIGCLTAAGQILLILDHPREAVIEFRSAVARAPSDLVLQTQLALALWQLGEGEAAVAVLNGVLGVDGGNREALRARGEILADIGNASSAKLDLERPSVRDRASALAAHGLALAELGDHSRATEEIDAARRSAPHDGRVLYYAARASALKGDKITTWDLAQQAVDATDPPLSPSHREVALKLAAPK
jgi:tetratricopeptide (TPR) repeat protein